MTADTFQMRGEPLALAPAAEIELELLRIEHAWRKSHTPDEWLKRCENRLAAARKAEAIRHG
jgi:hypothetical protein